MIHEFQQYQKVCRSFLKKKALMYNNAHEASAWDSPIKKKLLVLHTTLF